MNYSRDYNLNSQNKPEHLITCAPSTKLYRLLRQAFELEADGVFCDMMSDVGFMKGWNWCFDWYHLHCSMEEFHVSPMGS